MQASFWVQGHARRITVTNQSPVGVMIEVGERDEVLGENAPNTEEQSPGPRGVVQRRVPIICLGKGEARAIASAIMGAAAEL